jgi:hypothetical protein
MITDEQRCERVRLLRDSWRDVISPSPHNDKDSECSKPVWSVGVSERTRSRILLFQNRVDEQYSLSTQRVQRLWNLSIGMLCKVFVVTLCRVLLFPFELLCKLVGLDPWMVILR